MKAGFEAEEPSCGANLIESKELIIININSALSTQYFEERDTFQS